MLPQTTDERSLRTFWQRKEGTAGMAIIALLGVAGLFAAQALLPTIISVFTMGTVALGQLWMLAILGSSLAAFLWVLFMTPAPKLLGYWFKASVRRATNVFVAVYPIEIMQEFISKMKAKKQEFTLRREDIRKQQRVIDDTMKKTDEERRNALDTMQAAKKRGMEMEAALAAKEAGRAQETLEKFLVPASAQIKLLSERLTRVETVMDFKIRDMEGEVKNLKRQNEISKSAKSAIAAAKSILSGSDPDQELYDAATEFVVNDYRETMGLVDSFMMDTESILNNMDLKNGMWEESALRQLAQIEETERKLINATPTASIEIPSVQLSEGVPLPASNSSKKYF